MIYALLTDLMNAKLYVKQLQGHTRRAQKYSETTSAARLRCER